VVRLDEAIRQALRIGLLTTAQKGGKQASISECISAAHVIINAAHNTGKFLNKWVSQSKFDAAAVADGRLLLKETPTLFNWYAIKQAFALHRDVSEICQRMARSHSLVGKLGAEVGVKTVKAPASKPVHAGPKPTPRRSRMLRTCS